jgi:hypothetical protein
MLHCAIVIALGGTGCTTRTEDKPVVAMSSSPAAVPRDTLDWTVDFHGFGPIRIGQSMTALDALVPGLKSERTVADAECGYATTHTLPRGIFLMFEKGVLARVEVRDGKTTTSEGAGVGSSEAQIQSLYGSQMHTSPHKYIAGHYLTVIPADRKDSAFRIVFETDGSRVTRYRAGRLPAVEYVEGCA